MIATLFVDIECYRNLFYIGIKRMEDGKRVGFEFSRRRDFDRMQVRRILKGNLIVGFNSLAYDMPMIFYALTGASNDELKTASDTLIKGGVRWWDAEKTLGITIPRKIDHIDLWDTNPAVMMGLKILNGRLHGKRLQDLPFPEDARLTDAQMDVVTDYCLTSDLDATENLYKALREPLDLRIALGAQYGMDFRSKSDAQMGEAIIKKRIEEMTGKRPQKVATKPGTTFRYTVPDFFRFRTPQLQAVVERLRETSFVVKANGKVDLPKWLDGLQIPIGESVYSMGIGGLHSTEANRAVHSDEDSVLVDADVASQYPRIIMKLGLVPKALGKDFLTVYDGLIKDRIVAKRAGDKVKDKAGKIALNGAYGKLGSQYSVLYAPHLLIAVTLTGQLSLLMLIEAAELAGIPVVSGNTDGVIFRCPRALFNGFVMKDGKPTARLAPSPLAEIIETWERETTFEMEAAEYRSVYNASVNSYFAIKPDGSVKRKGPIGNPWSADPKENDVRAQLQKNPQMTICSDAALAHILHGTPVEETIRACRDIRSFVTVVNVKGGGTWQGDYLGKVVRYAWARGGEPILYKDPHPTTGNFKKVSKTDGCRPLMDLPDDFPDWIDHARYVEEAEKILTEIGFERPEGSSPYADLINQLLKTHIPGPDDRDQEAMGALQ